MLFELREEGEPSAFQEKRPRLLRRPILKGEEQKPNRENESETTSKKKMRRAIHVELKSSIQVHRPRTYVSHALS